MDKTLNVKAKKFVKSFLINKWFLLHTLINSYEKANQIVTQIR